MIHNFERSLKLVLQHEGGWSNHPEDPGGATMKGVTLRTFRRYYGEEATAADLRNITEAELMTVYVNGYWNPCNCPELPLGLDYAVFDGAVNSGPGQSAEWLQMSVGAFADGVIGPKTLKAVNSMCMGGRQVVEATIDNMLDLRMRYLRSLSGWNVFGRGWTNRVEGVRAEAKKMAGELPTDRVKAEPIISVVEQGEEAHDLAPCPCGKIPTQLNISEGCCSKWAYTYGDCCIDWNIEFRTHYKDLGSPELYELAVKAWNEAPRVCPAGETK
jgi:lysozyme family protein